MTVSDEQQLERIFNELTELRNGQVEQGNSRVRIETNLTNHIEGSGPYRDKVDAHDRSIQRLKGAGWVLSFLWGALLTALGIKYGVK